MRRGAPGDAARIRGRAVARPALVAAVALVVASVVVPGSGTVAAAPDPPGPVVPGPVVPGPVAAAAATCTGWTSHTTPPGTIRVLRTQGPAEDTVQVVPFRRYVEVVMAAEWGASNPPEALRAGAVAVKEYAWYQAMRWRGKSGPDGQCYDVVDSTVDQLYSPEDRDPAATLVTAVGATWDLAVHRSGRVFSTHYQGGRDVACGADADGTWLYQRSAMRCARDGRSAGEILLLYYGPEAVLVGGGATPGPSPTPTRTAEPSPSAVPAPTISLEASPTTIAWSAATTLAVALVPSTDGMRVDGRTIRFETSLDGSTWTILGNAATDAAGGASLAYRPIANRWYRTVLDPASDMPGVTSDPVRVVVRQRVTVTPDHAGSGSALRRGTAVTFTVLVRPARPDAPAGTVTVEAWRLANGAWRRETVRSIDPGHTGRTVVRVEFDAVGSWYVRARAASTATNANSGWTPLRRYSVR